MALGWTACIIEQHPFLQDLMMDEEYTRSGCWLELTLCYSECFDSVVLGDMKNIWTVKPCAADPQDFCPRTMR